MTNSQEIIEVLGTMVESNGQMSSLPVINSKNFKKVTYYKMGFLADLGANVGNMLLASDKKETGVTNFDYGNTLPKGKSLKVDSIRVLFGTLVTDTDPKTSKYQSDAPVAFVNGEFFIAQDGSGNLFESSGSDVTNRKIATTGNNDDFRNVGDVLLRSESPFQFIAKTVGALPAQCVYKLEIRGTLIQSVSRN